MAVETNVTYFHIIKEYSSAQTNVTHVYTVKIVFYNSVEGIQNRSQNYHTNTLMPLSYILEGL